MGLSVDGAMVGEGGHDDLVRIMMIERSWFAGL